MIKKKKQVRKRKKNPAPQFHDKLKELMEKEVTVRFRGENGFLSITGILENRGYNQYAVFYIEKNSIWGYITFKLNMIDNIQTSQSGFFIELKPSPYENEEVYDLNEILEYIKYNTQIDIAINTILYLNQGIGFPVVEHGRLKYNKSDKLFYVQSSNHKIQVSFNLKAIRQLVSGGGQIKIEI